MNDRNRLGDLQLAIMRVLWQRGEATAQDVHAALLDERGLAPTTIATMLKKMEAKGVVGFRVEGRRHVYRALLGERDVHRSMVSDLLDRVFLGNATALVDHLVREGELDERELDTLRRRIRERQSDPQDVGPGA